MADGKIHQYGAISRYVLEEDVYVELTAERQADGCHRLAHRPFKQIADLFAKPLGPDVGHAGIRRWIRDSR